MTKETKYVVYTLKDLHNAWAEGAIYASGKESLSHILRENPFENINEQCILNEVSKEESELYTGGRSLQIETIKYLSEKLDKAKELLKRALSDFYEEEESWSDEADNLIAGKIVRKSKGQLFEEIKELKIENENQEEQLKLLTRRINDLVFLDNIAKNSNESQAFKDVQTGLDKLSKVSGANPMSSDVGLCNRWLSDDPNAEDPECSPGKYCTNKAKFLHCEFVGGNPVCEQHKCRCNKLIPNIGDCGKKVLELNKISGAVCKRCDDTHIMEMADIGKVNCTSCPVPCKKCRKNGNGAYCEVPLCDCDCHMKDVKKQATYLEQAEEDSSKINSTHIRSSIQNIISHLKQRGYV